MKTNFLWILLVLSISLDAQERLQRLVIPMVSDTLTADMKSKETFVFGNKGYKGYFNLKYGVVVPPRFDHVSFIGFVVVQNDPFHSNALFYSVKKGKLFGIYRYMSDTVQMIACHYNKVELFKDATGTWKLKASKGTKVDYFDALGESQLLKKALKNEDEDLVTNSSNGGHGGGYYDPWDGMGKGTGKGDAGSISYGEGFKTNKDEPFLKKHILRTENTGKKGYMLFWNKNNKIGLALIKDTTILLKPEFTEVDFIKSRNIFAAFKDSFVKLFDTAGNLLEGPILTRYRHVDVYDFYLARTENNLYGIVDRQFNWLVKPDYTDARVSPHERMVGLFKEGKWWVYDNKIKRFANDHFEDYYTNFEHRFVVVKKDGVLAVYDSSAKSIKSLENYKFHQNEDTLALLKNGKEHLVVNLLNGHQINFTADSLAFFFLNKHQYLNRFDKAERCLIIRENNKFGLIDLQHKLLLPISYDSVFLLWNKSRSLKPYVVLKANGLWSYYSLELKRMVLDSVSKFYLESSFQNRRDYVVVYDKPIENFYPYIIKRNGKYFRFYDFKEKLTLPRSFDTIVFSNKNLMFVKSTNGYAIWNHRSNAYISYYDTIVRKLGSNPYYFLAKKHKVWYAFSMADCKMLDLTAFERYEISNDDIYIINSNKYGVLLKDNVYLPIQFDDIEVTSNKLIWTLKNGKWGAYKVYW